MVHSKIIGNHGVSQIKVPESECDGGKMAKIDDIKPGVLIEGLSSIGLAKIIGVENHGDLGVTVVFKDASGSLKDQLLYVEEINKLNLAEKELLWSFKADASLFRLVSEAYRIQLAYLFDPY
ncbi:MAG: hypothetical protein WA902_08970, partial [Thermosynechococcaceae cyanobacterium]